MQQEITAVAVGYHFGLIPTKDLEGISLTQTESHVRYLEQNWDLFKATSFADSQKLDALLDKYGDHPIADHKIEPVVMTGELELHVPGYDKARDSLLFGGYSFICNEKEIPLDFSGTSGSIRQNGDVLSVSFSTGDTPLITDYFLDDSYESAYSDIGLRIQDITAAFLAKTTGISEFMVSLELDGKEYHPEEICRLGKFSIRSLAFSDQKNVYPVKSDVLDEFNHTLLEASKTSRTQDDLSATVSPPDTSVWITVYKDTLGHADDHDNLTEICVPTDWLMPILRAQGVRPADWFLSYTADDTEDIARKARSEGVILDCSDPNIKKSFSRASSSLDHRIQDAQTRSSGSQRTSKAPDNNTRSDLPSRDGSDTHI